MPSSSRRSGAALLLAAVTAVAACTSEPPPDATQSPATSSAPTPSAIETRLATVTHLDNMLVRIERGDWDPEQGLALALRLLVGGAPPLQVLLRGEAVVSRDLTGIVAAGREQVSSIQDRFYRDDVEDVLQFMVFTDEQLEGMVVDPSAATPTRPPRPTPSGPAPTAGATDVLIEPRRQLPDAETDCQRYFRRFQVGNNETCLVMREAAIGDVAYKVYAPVASIASFRWEQRQHDLLDQAIAESIDVYGALGSLPSKVTIMFGINLAVHGDAMTVAQPDECRIMIYTGAQSRNDVEFKQVVAQQLAHCFQATEFPEQAGAPYAARGWREDGLAAYLGSLVYPAGNIELPALRRVTEIEDTISLFDLSAGAVAWWQYVANQEGWEGIETIVRALPGDGDAAARAEALSGVPEMDELFAGFAEAYIDGSIDDGSGGTLPTRWVPSAAQEQAAVDATGAIIDEPLEPFALRRHLLVVPGNLQATLSLAPVEDLAVRTRVLTGEEWGPLPEQYPPNCTTDVRLVMVVTSTAPEPRDARLSVDALESSGC